MKYLKTFETIDFNDIFSLNGSRAKREELKDFCETYLAYLMDDSIKELKVGKPTLLQTEKYVCYNVEIYFNKSVHWDQIKDQFIPFLQMVQKEYVGRLTLIFFYISSLFCLISLFKKSILNELLEDKIETNFTFELGSDRKASIQGNVGSIKLDILEEVSKD